MRSLIYDNLILKGSRRTYVEKLDVFDRNLHTHYRVLSDKCQETDISWFPLVDVL